MEGRQYPGGVYEGQLLNSAVPIMRFTLVYDGPLPAQNSHNGRNELKHRMREVFHRQLAELWSERRSLRDPLEIWRRYPARRDIWLKLASPEMSHRDIIEAAQEDIARAIHTTGESSWRFRTDSLHNLGWTVEAGIIVPFRRGPFTFFPLATKRWDLVCDLSILFLRAEAPGALFPNTRGDLDNRLKVLFDALTMPEHDNQLPTNAAPDSTQDPFFCLLEDDKLITSFHVDSERLLDEPPGGNRVKLVVRVTMKTRRVNMITMELEGD